MAIAVFRTGTVVTRARIILLSLAAALLAATLALGTASERCRAAEGVLDPFRFACRVAPPVHLERDLKRT
jgi:hypothetical protein